MKKAALIILIGFITICSSAQGVYGEFNIGFPTSDTTSDTTYDLKMEFNVKGGYLWKVSSGLVLGPTIGFSWISTKNENAYGLGFLEAFQIYTVGATTRYGVSKIIVLGADLGYGHFRGLIDGSSGAGGFYYRPLIGFKIVGNFSINISYESFALNKNGENGIDYGLDSYSSFQLGVSFN